MMIFVGSALVRARWGARGAREGQEAGTASRAAVRSRSRNISKMSAGRVKVHRPAATGPARSGRRQARPRRGQRRHRAQGAPARSPRPARWGSGACPVAPVRASRDSSRSSKPNVRSKRVSAPRAPVASASFSARGRSMSGSPRKERHEVPVKRRAILFHQLHRRADRAVGQRRDGLRAGVVGQGKARLFQRRGKLRRSERVEAKRAAARADRRQKPRGLVRDQEHHRVARRLLQFLQQCVGRRDVHLVGAIDDDHATRPARREREEPLEAAHLVDGQLRLETLALRVPGAPQKQEARIGQRAQAARNGMVRVDMKALRRRRRETARRRCRAGSRSGSARRARRRWPCPRPSARSGARREAGGPN